MFFRSWQRWKSKKFLHFVLLGVFISVPLTLKPVAKDRVQKNIIFNAHIYQIADNIDG